MSITSFERYPLLFGPSPVHPLERLTRQLGGAAVWAKREDCNSGIACGGNKTRKLEYLVPDAMGQGCDTLVSIGGVQSNHTRQVAAVAARVGLDCVLVQESWVDWPDPVYDKVGNILISRLAGAVRLVRAGFGIGVKESWEQALGEIEARGGTPYAIPAGASDHPARRARLRPLGARGRRAGGAGRAAVSKACGRSTAQWGSRGARTRLTTSTGSARSGRCDRVGHQRPHLLDAAAVHHSEAEALLSRAGSTTTSRPTR